MEVSFTLLRIDGANIIREKAILAKIFTIELRSNYTWAHLGFFEAMGYGQIIRANDDIIRANGINLRNPPPSS